MNKRAATISFEMLMWIPRFVYLVIVIMSVMGIIYAFIVTNVSVAEIESQVLLDRLYFSPDGVSEFDAATGRVYTGVVYDARFSSAQLSSALDAGRFDLAGRLVMYGLDGSRAETVYLNEDTYRDWQPIAIVVSADKSVEGSGRKFPHAESRYVYSGAPSRMDSVVISSE